MTTECNQQSFGFHAHFSREVVGRFDGGSITSDGGALLLREVEAKTGIIRQFASCFTDHRDPELIEHRVEELVGQRVYGLALGYEDLNDHDDLRHDPLLAVLVGKKDPTGGDRVRSRDRGKALAGKSTLNRLELTPADATRDSRYKKIVVDKRKAERFFVETFLQAHAAPPKRIVLDLDATDAILHGHQQGRFFHGYYGNYCYLPLYIFCGEFLLCARLRPSHIDAPVGCIKILSRIVEQIRAAWPETRIVIRGDSGFCRETLMTWCESNGVDYVLGFAKNERLTAEIAAEMAEARAQYEATKQASRVFKDFTFQTRDSWSVARRVVGKAEHLAKGENPRFIVTSIPKDEMDARTLYEDEYCARGEMENRIKEQQLYLFADRCSAATMRANQQRLWFSATAYVLMQALRRLGLQDTELAQAQCHTIRLKVLKIGARVRITVRKVWVSWAECCPYQAVFRRIHARLARLAHGLTSVQPTPTPLRC
jgi:Transposase DDE domain group 1